MGIVISAALIVGAGFLLTLIREPELLHTDVGLKGTKRIGWETSVPYSYEVEGKVVGLSADIARAALRRIGYDSIMVQEPWAKQLELLEEGRMDVAMQAFLTPERQSKFFVSAPYFSIIHAVFHSYDTEIEATNLLDLADEIVKEQWKIGVIEGAVYPPPIQAMLDRPEIRRLTVPAKTEEENIRNLVVEQVRLVFEDYVAAEDVLQRNEWEGLVEQWPHQTFSQPVHFLLSRDDFTAQEVAAFDEAIATMRAEGQVSRIARQMFYPALGRLISESAFLQWIIIIAAITAAVSGVMIAHLEKYDIVGALVLASAPAVGGGVIRDLIAGRIPVQIMRDPLEVIAIVAVVLAGFIFYRLKRVVPQEWMESEGEEFERLPSVMLFDTLGLAGFTVIAVLVAVQMRCEPLWLWGPLLASVNNGGGALIRDLVRKQASLDIIRGNVLPEIAIVWGFLFSLFMIWYSDRPPYMVQHVMWAAIATMAGVVVTRYACEHYRIKSPPY